MKLYKERPRLNVRANSFSNRVANTWNQLQESVVMAPSLNAFKGRLNAYWIRHPQKFNPACYETGTTTGQRFQIPKASIQIILANRCAHSFSSISSENLRSNYSIVCRHQNIYLVSL